MLINRFLLLSFFFFIAYSLIAQTKNDSLDRIKARAEINSVYGNEPDNYYAPFHCRIKDTAQATVSKFGHYSSFGLGGGSAKGEHGVSVLASYSFAYKSHLVSLTGVRESPFNFGGGDNLPYFFSYYGSCLVGESLRNKNLLLSLSAGIAYSDIAIKYPNPNAVSASNAFARYFKQGITFPIELKLFLLSRNAIGAGLQVSKNIVSPVEFSPFYWGISIVLGKWNK